MAKIPVGLQLYTLRDDTSKDFIGTLKKVADMGYKVVEFAGYGDIPAKEMRKVLDDLGLEASSSHVGLPLTEPDKLKSQLSEQIEYNLEIGSKYIFTPWAPVEQMKTEEALQNFIDTLRGIGQEVNRNGLQYGYHNHAFEFVKRADGKYILDWMYESVDADTMLAELDLYWVKKGGLDPKQYLLSYKGRVPVIHVKDMTADERAFFAEVGQGIIDYPSIFSVAEEAGVKYYIVEQDQCERPPLESVKMSIDYLKSIGIA
jgi:sugar phosphate isomerase/epimerase